MAHEGIVLILVVLGAILLIAYYLGPRNEVRATKRLEAKIMLVPTGILLFFLAAVIVSGILG
ncbi:MAG: hypothetical protein QXS20_10565 [Candidatus Thorarchaeota archaeon]